MFSYGEFGDIKIKLRVQVTATAALVQEQREEMRSLREDALQEKGRMSYADVTRTTQVKPTNTTLLVGNELLQGIHVDETKDGDPIKIRRLSGAAFDAIGSMIDDAATEDRIKEIIIVAGTHELTEDIPVEQIQVDFEVLLRKAKAVTSEITVSSVLPVIRDNAIKLGRLIEVNERLKATCDELEVKFVDNDANLLSGMAWSILPLLTGMRHIYPRAVPKG